MIYSWLLEHAALPLVLRSTHSKFWDEYKRMIALDRQPKEVLEPLQWQRFQSILNHAYANVAYYRDRMTDGGIHPGDIQSPEDLARLPITTKADIQRNFPDRITDQSDDPDDWRYVSTGGTANKLIAVHDFGKRDVARAATLRSLRVSGNYRVGKSMVEIPPDACNLFCGAEGQSNDGVMRHFWKMVRSGRVRDSAAIRDLRGQIEIHWFFRNKVYAALAARDTAVPPESVDACIDQLRRDRPYLLKALPTYLHLIAQRVAETGAEPLPIRIVKPMGASVSPVIRETIASAFAGQYREDYGSAELGGIACDCDAQEGLHVFSDLFLVEVIKGDGSAGEGELGRIVITDLFNHAMPLIRYQIGDVGRLFQAPCKCGRTTPRLFVDGRLEDTVVNSDGKIITSDQITDLMYGQGGIEAFQLIEKQPGRFELLVVPTANQQNGDWTGDLQRLLDDNVEIRQFVVQSIKPETGGKYRMVKSCSYERLQSSRCDGAEQGA